MSELKPTLFLNRYFFHELLETAGNYSGEGGFAITVYHIQDLASRSYLLFCVFTGPFTDFLVLFLQVL